jgi:hypothetical protein
MAGRKAGRFVEEEKLGVAVRGHDDALSPAKFEHAQQPSPDLPVSPDSAVLVVQTAAIAHHRAAVGGRDDDTGRCDTVLPRHARLHP